LVSGGEDIGLARDCLLVAGQGDGLCQRQQRLVATLAGQHGEFSLEADGDDIAGVVPLAVDIPVVLEIAGNVPQALVIIRPEGVNVADRIDPLAKAAGNPGDHHPAIGMAGKDEAVEPGFSNLLAHVVYMVGQGDAAMQLVLPRSQPA